MKTPDYLWPDGKKCGCMVTFDYDSESLWFSENAAARYNPATLSQGGFGPRRGVPALLETLSDLELPASFYVPGWTAEKHTSSVEAILKAGHEIGHHGYLHKWTDPSDPHSEIEEMERGLEALKNSVGVVPKGYRCPGGAASSEISLNLLKERGFLYNSGFLDDVYPYRHVLPDGSKGPIELPFHWNLDDSAIALYVMESQSTILTNSHILEVWTDEFDAIRDWGGLVNIVLHPQISGRPARLAMLRKFLEYARSFDDVWFATGTQVAEAFEINEAK